MNVLVERIDREASFAEEEVFAKRPKLTAW